jgi:arylsulfatase
VFKTGKRNGHREICFEHFNEKAMIDKAGWKIVMPAESKKWELYNLNVDRSELDNLAEQYPERVKEMGKRYLEWEKRCMVVPRP